MSTDTPTATEVDEAGAEAAGDRSDEQASAPAAADDCGLCDATVADEGRYLACYATPDATAPDPADRDGVLALCGSCAREVAELSDAWDGQGPPALAGPASIAAGYRERAEDCSFCDGDVADGPVLGIDSWPSAAVGDGDDATHYALCGDCGPIFAEFLRGVSEN